MKNFSDEVIIARAALIAAAEHHNTLRKRKAATRAAWRALVWAKARCAALGA